MGTASAESLLSLANGGRADEGRDCLALAGLVLGRLLPLVAVEGRSLITAPPQLEWLPLKTLPPLNTLAALTLSPCPYRGVAVLALRLL